MQRHKVFGSILFSVLLLAPAASHAVDFSLLGGIWDDPGNGDELFGVGGRLAFFHGLQLEVSASYYSDFESRVRVRQGDGGVDFRSAELEVVPIEAGLRSNFGGSPTGFYLAGGAGLYMVDLDGRGGFGDEVGFYVSAGWQYEHFFLEALYRDVNGTFDEELGRNPPPGANLDLSGLGVQLGWRF